MKKHLRLLFIFIITLGFNLHAQVAETEPNNNLTDGGVQTIGDGTYSGNINIGDVDIYKIPAGSSGTITVTYTLGPGSTSIGLFDQTNILISLANTNIPGTFTYALNPTISYALKVSNIFGSGAWKFSVSGIIASALNNSGSGSFVSRAAFALGNNWTAEAWINPSLTAGGWYSVLGQNLWDNNEGFIIKIENGLVGFVIPGPAFIDIETPITGGVWTHVAATYNNGVYAFYKNGVLVGTQTGQTYINTAQPFYMGIRNDNSGIGLIDTYAGSVDEVRIWSTTRSQCEIRTFMNCEIPTSGTGLLANYHFNQGSPNAVNTGINTLLDATANSNHATLTSFTLSGTTSNWVSPGGVTTGSTTSVAQTGTIQISSVTGNVVTNNASATSTLNSTDFGYRLYSSFVIKNTGSGPLFIGTPYFTGTNATDFYVATAAAGSISAGASTTLIVGYSAAALGVSTASVHIISSDCGTPVFNYAIKSTSVANSFNFNGSNTSIYMGTTPATYFGTNSAYTIEAWIWRKAGTGGMIASMSNIGVSAAWHFSVSPTGVLTSFRNVSPFTFSSAVGAIPDETWTHVATVYNGSNLALYINGVGTSTVFTGSIPASTSAPFLIGANLNTSFASNFFNGYIDELHIYNFARGGTQIMADMTSRVDGTEFGLVTSFDMNVGSPEGTNTGLALVPSLPTAAADGTVVNGVLSGCTANWICGAPAVGACDSPKEIVVTGNALSISNNDITTSVNDYTDFGNVLTSATFTRTFLILNQGNTNLTISGYTVSGANASNFTVTSAPASVVTPSNSTYITLVFSTASAGVKTASISIGSNDCDEGLFKFNISATGVDPGAALNFDGTNDNVTIGSGPVLYNQSFTVEFWAKRGGNSSDHFAICQGIGINNNGLQIGFRSSNDFTFAFFNNDINVTVPATTDGLYHHWACVYDKTNTLFNQYVYCDGALVAKRLSSSDFLGSGSVYLGYAPFLGGYFKGNVDELRIWGSARTQCEIQTYMNCEITGAATNLLGNYHFNQGASASDNSTITTLTDASGNSRSGTFNNMPLNSAGSNFVTPGGVVSNFTTVATPSIAIKVTGNGTTISNGSTSPLTTNFTDFNGTTSRTFSVVNNGTTTVYVSTVTLSGANASEFVIATQPSGTTAVGGSGTFVVNYNTTGPGTKTAIVTVKSNDCTAPNYSFVITASTTPAAALDFDGNNDIITVNSTALLGNFGIAPFCLEAWVYPTDVTIINSVIRKDGDYNLLLNGTKVQAEAFPGGSGGGPFQTGVTATGVMVANQWQHVAAVWNGTTFAIYVNGISKSVTMSGSSAALSSVMAIGGSINYGQNFKGRIDEVRLWKTSRSQCQIQSFMVCEIPAPATNLVANYHFNQGISSGANSTYSLLPDVSGNSHTGTLLGFGLSSGTSNWVTPGGVVSDYTTATAASTASLLVKGNSANILNGATATGTNNFTDFGTVFTRTYVTTNATGTGTLYINTVSLSGANAADFSVTTVPTATAITSGTGSFVITFNPSALGTRSAVVTVAGSDCTAPNYSFVISGIVTPADALAFNGSNLVSCGNILPSSYTKEAWVKFNTTGLSQNVVSGANNNGAALWAVANSGLRLSAGHTANFQAVADPNLLSTGTWYHVAVTYDAPTTTMKLYKNGILVSTSNTVAPATDNNIVLGSHATGLYLNGSMDEVRIWNTVRTQCDIQSYMSAEITSTASGLVANYHFNQGVPSGSNTAVTTLTDAAGANTGTLSAFTLTGTTSNWVSPGGVIQGSTTINVPTASLIVTGNTSTITAGTITTGTANLTNFGPASSRTFVMKNVGTGNLYITSVRLSGANAADFSITSSTAITLGTATPFNLDISFIPLAVGTRSAVVNIESSDCAAPNYSFVITASVAPASALGFDGGGTYIEVPVINFSASNKMTIEGWIKPTDITTNANYAISMQTGGTDWVFEFQNNGTKLSFGLSTQSNGYSQLDAAITPSYFTNGNWHHVAAVYDGAYQRIYVDGQQVAAATKTGNVLFSGSHQNIGKSPVGLDFFKGYIDELRYWNTGRTQCEIQANMFNELPPATAGLVTNYHFNQGIPSGSNTSVTNLIDALSGNTGTLANFALTGSITNWVSPGGVVNDYTLTTPPAGIFVVTGNSATITAGSGTTSTTNFTDFGGATTRTFVAKNAAGSGTLYINGVTLSGGNASDFSVTTLPATSLTANGTSNFVITFSPTALGTKTAIVNVNSSDCTAPNYSFVITASTTPAAALNFDGTSDYISVPYTSSLSLNSGSFSLEYLARPTAVDNNFRWVISKDNGNGNLDYQSGLNSNNVWRFCARNLGIDVRGTTTPVPGNLYHIACTYDGITARLYVNGVLETSSTATAAVVVNTSNILIGARTASSPVQFFKGDIDEVRLWNVTRSQCDIQSYMACEIPATATGLLANYHFNQGIPSGSNSTVTTLTDAAGANTGALTTFSLNGATSNWVSPGGVTSGSTTPNVPTATLMVTGNSTTITAGTVATGTANFTDFNGASTRTFVAKNAAGSGTLYINGVTLSGASASDFSVTTLPATSLTSNGTSNFVITFAPTAIGNRTAMVTVNSSDCTSPNYNFVITASTTAASALAFNGGNSIQLQEPNFADGDLTIEAWVKPNLGSHTYVLSTRDGQGGACCNYWDFGFSNTGQPFFEVANSGTIALATIGFNSTIPSGTWSHIAAVRKGLLLNLYINGVLTASANTTGAATLTTGYNKLFMSGSGIGGAMFSGTLDEVRLWNVARTQCQLQTFMNAEITSTASGLISNYHFNQGIPSGANTTVTTLTDATGSNNGTLNGFVLTSGNSTSNWVSPGGVANGYTTTVPSPATLTVKGNGTTIAAGSVTTTTTNFTDFGGVSTRTFVTQNAPAGSTLYINGVTLSGANAADFVVTTAPTASAIAGVGSGSFAISFSPTAVGNRTAIVTINSSDCNVADYSFVITASATPAAALAFDPNAGNYITTPAVNLNGQSFTVEFWAKKNTLTNSSYLVGQNSGSSLNQILHVGFRYDNTFAFAFFGNDLDYTVTPAIDNNWHHWAAVYNANSVGTDRFIYMDGTLVASDDSPSNYTGSASSLLIGSANGFYYNGTADELRVWNTARTQCEIQTYMRCEIPGTASGLLANYHFNQGLPSGANSGVTTLTDATGVNNGTLNNFILTSGNSTSNWVSPGGVISGSIIASMPTASLVVTGNSATIAAGSLTTTTANFTDFGSAGTRTFVAKNAAGSGTLYVNSVTLSGGNASEFTVTTLPAASLTANGTSNFVITFSGTAVGSRTAVVTVNSSDCNAPNYSFVITATTTAASGLNFDGNDDRIITPAISLDNRSFSVEFWAKRTSGSTVGNYVFGQGQAINPNEALHIGFRGTPSPPNIFTFAFYSNDINYTTTAATDGNFHHWACVFDVTATGNNRFLYLDGVLVAKDHAVSSLQSVGPMVIGDGGSYFPGYPSPMNGTVDELRVWQKALTQCEILTNMNCEIVSSPSLVANYHFNQGVPAGNNAGVTTLTDATGVNTGTLNGFGLNGSTSNWISPTPIINNYTTTAPPAATLTVSGNAVIIAPGSVTTSTSNFTDFGGVSTRTFSAKNAATATSPLYVNNVLLSGASAADFSVTALPAASLAANATGNFVITFSPTAVGNRTAFVTVQSSDCTAPNYSFVITASATPASALNFNNPNDYIDLGSSATLKPASALTAEAWIYSSNWPSIDQTMFGNTENAGYGIFTKSTGELEGLVHRNSGFASVTMPLASVSAGWHHVALTYDGQYTKLYLDGVVKAVNNAGGVYPVDYINNNTLIGAEASSGSTPIAGWDFTGSIDELRIWNIARSQCDILSHMSSEIPAITTGLVANYHFNQGIPSGNNAGVTTLTDAGGSAITGTLTNFNLTGSTSNWISPGGVANGYTTVTSPSTASLLVKGNGAGILNGSTTTNISNFTDFGSATTRTYVTTNATGSGTLYINNISLSGANPADFSVTTVSTASSITTGTGSFAITFSASAIGTRSAIVTINSSDCTAPNYSFVITGSAATAEALNFDGVNDEVRTVVTSNFNMTNGATIEGWFNTSVAATMEILAVYTSTGTGMEANMDNGRFGFNAYLGTNWVNYVNASGPAFNDGQWHHFAVSSNSNVASAYIDGVFLASITGNGSLPAGSASVTIGRHPNAPLLFNGSLDDIRIWNKARSQCEIQSYMRCEITTTATGLAANYHFNQGIPSGSNATVTTLTDAAGGNNGTLANFTLTGTTSNWVSPGGVITGSTTPATPGAVFAATGNGNLIGNNSVPNTSNFTDFGTVSTRTFVVKNSGTGTLSVNAPFTFSGTNAANFSVTTLPATTLSAGASSSFVVTFTASAATTQSAVLNLSSSDCTTPNFSLVLSGSGTMGEALSFVTTGSLTGNYVTVPHSASVNLGNAYTIEAWINYTGANAAIVDKGDYDFALEANPFNTGKLGFFNRNTATWNYSAGNLPQGVWTHAAVTLNAGVLTFYINGAASGTAAVIATQDSGPVNIGRQSPTTCGCNSFNGTMDELRLWNVARTCDQILGNMNNELIGNEPGLGAYYKFNQGAANGNNITNTVVIDATGVNNGTLSGSFALTGTVSNWVAPGSPATGTVSTPQAEINIQGNGNSIVNNDITPSATDNTDFGTTCVNTSRTKIFTIQNVGTTTLSVTSVAVTGPDASLFSVATTAGIIAAGGSDTFTLAFSPTTSGIKNATVVVNSTDCDEGTYAFAITGSVSTAPTLTVNSGAICSGGSFTMTPSGALSYTYSSGSAIVNPASTTSYSVAGTNASGCVSTTSAISTVTVNALPTPTITASSASVCNGSTLSLTASGATTYTWSNSLNSTTVSAISITITPTANVTYSASATNSNGCIGSASQTIVVNGLPTVTVPNGTICAGQSFTINPSGASNYTYTGGGPVVSPTLTTTYSVSGSNAAGCTNTTSTSMTLTVNAAPSVSVNSGAICSGSSFTMTPSGAVSYTYSSGSAVVNPVSNTSYSVAGIDANGCVSTTSAISTVTVNALPTPTITASTASVCNGSSLSLTASGATSYTWSNSLNSTTVSATSITITPTANVTYSASATNSNGCVGSAIQTLVVNALPTVTVPSGTICPGNSFTFNPSGASTYSYSSGSNIVTPGVTTTYSILGASAAGCVASGSVTATVSVINSITVSVTGNTLICNGQTASLTANGATTYSWSTGATTTLVALSPTVNTTYTVYGASGTCSNNAVVSVSVNAVPSVSVNSGAICSGSSFTMTPSGAVSYTYSSGSAVVNPASTTSYSVAGIDANGCVSTTSAISTITVNALPTPTITASTASVCNGSSLSLTASGATSYTWSNSLNSTTLSAASITITPTANVTYSASATNSNGCVGSAIQTLVVNALPTVTVPSGTICPGNSFTFNPSGASTYSYSSGSNIVTPGVTTTYSILGQSAAGCVASGSVTATVSVINSITVSVTGNTLICNGQTASLTANGATTYSWNTGATTTVLTVAPSANTTYTVYGASGTCSNSAVVSVSVNAVPTITVNSGAVCAGNSFTLIPGGAVTYTYSGGTAVVTPVNNSTYSVSGTDANNCVSTTSAISTVSINALPTPTITASTTSVCNGSSLSLTGSGATSYIWSNSLNSTTVSATSITITPTANVTYSASATNSNGCVGSAIQTLVVNALPTVTVPSGTICPGNSFTFNPSGASTYSYSSGSNIVTPGVTTTYSILGQSAAGCVASASVNATVSVINSITVSVTGNTLICNGQTASLTANGATTYSWNTGATTTVLTVAPSANTTYTVYGVSGTCSNNAVVSVSVNAVPTITVNSGAVCAGNSFTLIPGGALSYTYSSGSAIVNPLSNTTYSVAGANAAGCVSTASAISTVTVNALPALSIAASATSACVGSALTLTASGASTYTWSNSLNSTTISAASVTVTPAANVTYTALGVNASGCFGSATQLLSANPLPTITVPSGAVCPGGSFTFNPSGASTYSYSNGSNIVTPLATADYSIGGTSAAGCVASTSAVATVSVVSTLTISVTGNTTICSGSAASLTVGGASTYSWSTGVTTDSVTLSPAATTNYTVYGFSGSCVDKALVTVSVTSLPTITVNSGTVCAGNAFTLNPSGAATYSYSGGSAVVTPSANSDYSVTGTDANGCVSANAAIASLTVAASPALITSASPTVCAGSSASLSVSGAVTYSWSSAQTSPSIVVTPAASTVYTVSGTDAGGCSSTATLAAFVSPGATLNIVQEFSTVCQGSPVTLSVSGAESYTWSNGATSTSISVTPTTTTHYSVTGAASGSCNAAASAVINVHVLPVLNLSASDTLICTNTTVNITASGAVSYAWSTGQIASTITPTLSADATFTVTGINTNSCSNSAQITIIVQKCNDPVEPLTGVTANTDGINDTWMIRNIEEYPNNKISIFNRWGIEVASITGYNNNSKTWPTADDLPKLSASTYYYIIDLKNGTKPVKGWVELIK